MAKASLSPTAQGRKLELRMSPPPYGLAPNEKTKVVVDALGRKRRKAIHWSEKAGNVRVYRWDCQMDARQQAQQALVYALTSPVKATVTFIVPDKRRRDLDNLMASIKPLWDGLKDARVLVDDSSEHLRHGEPTLRVEKGVRAVLVTLQEVEP